MQSVESTISSAFLDCYDVALHDPSKPSDHFSSYPRFVFSPTGSIICSFSPNQLYCRFPNDKVFSWTPSEFSLFSTVLKNWPSDAPRSWTIADATFLPYSSQILLLLAPPESGKPLRSIICFIDLNDGIVVSFQRFICVRGRAEKIHVVSTEPSTLPGFQGAVVVALEHGQIALLDLCLGWNIPDITYLETSVCISVEQCLESLAEDQPISTMSPKMEHALVILNASRISLNNFYYQTPRNETIGRFASVSVNVTLLNYVSQIKALVVGFSFGGWQLWSLTKLKLLFTFRDLPPMPVPVVECAFTEPSDDPRYYCYLWIGWQSIINHSNSISDSTGTSGTANPKVGLFQLGFRERTERIQPETEDTLYEYDNFYGGTRRLSTILTPLKTSLSHEPPHWKAQGPLLTSIQSLGANYTPNFGLRSNRLTALVWRAAPNIIRIGLFDLDRWYHAQMPSGIRSDNSFFTVYDAFLDQPRAYPLTAYVLPHTIFAFWANVYRMELSAFKICGEVSAVQGPLRGYQDLRKPLLECQLRPSTHGFKALVPFIIDYSVAFSTQTFISRQESALREISSAISKALTSNSTTFDPTEWITEAAACGLLQEFEDSDIDILQALKEVEGSDWILRLAIGLENPPQELLKQIELIDGEEEWEGGDFESFNPSPQKDRRKRRILPLRDTDDHRRGVKRPRSVVENETTRGVKYLPPAWVIIANCLLDHGMYEDIKKLDVLISSQEELNFNPKVFMRRWLWLKWLGKKYCLEELLMPIFESEKEVKSKLTYEDGIKELCLCFQSLRVLADIAKVVMSPSFIIDGDFENSEAVSAEAKLKVIQSLAEYTRPVSLLIRLGLLPQSAHFKPRSSALSPYNYEEINGLIVKLQGMQNASITRPPFITDCLLDHLRSILNTSDQIDTASLNALTSSYPPKHLQSICALWRCFDMSTASSGLPTHLALLCFILFDAVTVTALHEDATQAIEDNDDDDEIKQDPPIHVVGRLRLVEVDKNAAHFVPSSAVLRPSPVARAVKLQQYVVNQVGNEFPNFGKFVSTVRTLWLLDRFRFSDVLCSRLSILATGQVTDLAHLPEVFPNQSRLVADFCARYGQTELAARFDPHFNLNQTAGCVVPGLYQARQLYYQKSDSHEAAAILIKVANSFKKRGQFLDFISPGLSQWEAAVLFTDLRNRGEKRLLLAALIAGAQYKEAQVILTELDSSGGRKLSVDPTVRSLISTISTCLPQLKFFSVLPHLRPRLQEGSLQTGRPSVAPSVTGSDRSKGRCCPTLHVEEGVGVDSLSSKSHLARQFATPKGKRLPFQPSIEDRMRATEFWNQFDVTQRVLRGEKPFETPRSPVKPNITDSARRLRRKLNQLLYSSSVISPFQQKNKASSLFASVPESTASAASGIATGHRGSDFWSELGEMNRKSDFSTTASTVTASRNSKNPSTTSILKVRSVPKDPVASDDDDMSPPTLPPQKIRKRRTLLLTMADGEKADEPSSSSVADFDISTSDILKDGNGDGETCQLNISSDDAEITINASTLHLSHRISLSEGSLNDSKLADESLRSTGMYSFSPPIRTINSDNAQPSGMDEVGNALCTARHFVFASPATFLARKFVPPSTASPGSLVDDESGDFNFNVSATSEGFTFDNVTEEDVEEDGNECSADVALTAEDDDMSTLPGTEDEVESVELLTPRRSKRKIKVPERFKY